MFKLDPLSMNSGCAMMIVCVVCMDCEKITVLKFQFGNLFHIMEYIGLIAESLTQKWLIELAT